MAATVSSTSYESVIDRQQRRIAELELDIERYSAQIKLLKTRTLEHQHAAAAAAAAAAAHSVQHATANSQSQGIVAAPIAPPNTPNILAARAAAVAAAAVAAGPQRQSAPPNGQTEEDERAGKTRYWTEMEHNQFLYAVKLFGPKNYVAISQFVGTRTPKQVRTHAQKYQMKLEREARKRRAQAAAVAAAGAPGAAAAAAAVAAAAAACDEQRASAIANASSMFANQSAAKAAIEAAAASAVMAYSNGAHGIPFPYHRMAMYPGLHLPIHPNSMAFNRAVLNASPIDDSSCATGSQPSHNRTGAEPAKTEPSKAEIGKEKPTPVAIHAKGSDDSLPSFEQDNGNDIQHFRDSACSPVSNDSSVESDMIVMVDEKGGVVKADDTLQTTLRAPVPLCPGLRKNSSLGNLADYDDFMKKITTAVGSDRQENGNLFDEDGELELEMLSSSVKSEQFEDSLLRDI